MLIESASELQKVIEAEVSFAPLNTADVGRNAAPTAPLAPLATSLSQDVAGGYAFRIDGWLRITHPKRMARDRL